MAFDKYAHLPEDQAQYYRAHEAHHKTEQMTTVHQSRDFLDNLDGEQLEALDVILASATTPEMRGYLRGQIAQLIRKHGKCPCGESHQDINDLMAPISVDPKVETEDFDVTMKRLDDMEKYGVRPDSTVTEPRRVVCIECGMDYRSLEDRMLRPPKLDGCSGCMIKSAHG